MKASRFLIVLFFLSVAVPATLCTGNTIIFNTQEFAPFSYKSKENRKQILGPGIEIIQAVCDRAKLSCKFVLKIWSRAQYEVQNGKAHGLFLIGWNKKRTEWLNFSPPVLETEYGFFVKKDTPLYFKKVSDISGYKVGVFGPSNTANSLKKIKKKVRDMTIDQTVLDESVFRKLARGRVHAAYSNKDVGWALIKKLNLKNMRYAGAHRKLKYYVGLSKKYVSAEDTKRFNRAFAQLHKEGVIQKIVKSHGMTAVGLK